MQSQGLALPPKPEVGPLAARVSTKESCVYSSGNDPDTGDHDVDDPLYLMTLIIPQLFLKPL